MSDLERWNATMNALQAHQHRLLQMGRVDAANRLGLAILELTEMSRPEPHVYRASNACFYCKRGPQDHVGPEMACP